MPRHVGDNFAENLFFLLSALEFLRFEHIAHFGSLLGAARLQGTLPWDEDHDIYLVDCSRNAVEAGLRPILEAHGFELEYDSRHFFWVRQKHWYAASGHLALHFLPALIEHTEDLPVWKGGAPHLLRSELRPLRRYPFYSSYIFAPAESEQPLQRLYAESGSPTTMGRFRSAPIHPETKRFWAAARPAPNALDWPAICKRFRQRSRWNHMSCLPWWWFNGAFIIGINRLRAWAQARLQTRNSTGARPPGRARRPISE
ncbi:LicD family protein [bacterium]|nr:LicD family protein [bacterium]